VNQLSEIIIVDLDGTLIKTDLLYESLLVLLRKQPWAILLLPFWLLRGKAAFKRELSRRVQPDFVSLPFDERLVRWLRLQHSDGKKLALFSASDQTLLQPVADQLQLFEEVHGSDGARNLSGADKYAAIEARYGAQFTYVGDSRKDIAVWSRCGSAVLVGATAKLRSQLPAGVAVVEEFARPVAGEPGSAALWRRALRLHQWAKNALIFVPLFLSGRVAQPGSVLNCAVAFVAFGLLASATYIVNDLLDLAADRSHRTKKDRPFASGALPIQAGLAAIPLLMLAAAGLATLLPKSFALIAGLYTVTTVAYSLGLKREPILDLLILSGLFTVRILAGMVSLDTPLSKWLLAFSMFFFFSLAATKRYTECDHLLAKGSSVVPGRGYRPQDAPWLLAMGAASALSSVLVFLLYLVHAKTEIANFPQPAWLGVAPPILGYWLGRVWLLAVRGEMRDDPIVFALKDRRSIVLGMVVIAAIFLAVFRKG
jgi:4-hydroxybenzoate polyprenyltransferase/phosphoglycolate phosphatase-like HAD superfamily hydrolase